MKSETPKKTTTMESQNTGYGPELRGSNITLAKITAPTDVTKRQTKIICTLGPACWDVKGFNQLEELIDAGLSVARFNFSHGDHGAHKACLDRLREAAKNKGKHVGKYLFVDCMDRRSYHTHHHRRRRVAPKGIYPIP